MPEREEPCTGICKQTSHLGSKLLITKQRFGSVENPMALEREVDNVVALQYNALLLLLLLSQESGTCGVFENFTDTLVGLC